MPSYGHAPFLSDFRLTLPANGRLVLPATFRRAFGDEGVVRIIGNEFANLYTPRAFTVMALDMAAKGSGDLLHPRARKRLHASAKPMSIDGQGRFVLPPAVREGLGIEPGDEVVLAGAIECIEIWHAVRYDEEEAPAHADPDLFLRNYGGLES